MPVPCRRLQRARDFGDPARQRAYLIRTLPSLRVMSGDASLAHVYYAFGIVFRGRYDDQILGPRCHFPQFVNGLCGHGNAPLRLDPHMTRQATKSYV